MDYCSRTASATVAKRESFLTPSRFTTSSLHTSPVLACTLAHAYPHPRPADPRYTIQGGDSSKLEERGLLPRSVDVVFNSIKGFESKANVRVWRYTADLSSSARDCLTSSSPTRTTASTSTACLSSLRPVLMTVSWPMTEYMQLTPGVKVDRNFSYAVFVSYVEVYNDKVS